MFKVKLVLFLIASLILVVDANSQNLPPEISVTGEQVYCYEAPIPIVTSATISDPDVADNTLDEIYLQISEGYSLGNDTLSLGGVNPNITASWSISEALLTLTGPATFAEFEYAIENVFFETTQTAYTSDRSFSINLGNANYLPSTEHYYFYVSNPGITWAQARDAAAAQTYFGLQGYLATLTALEEAQLAGEQSAGTGWIGASDEEVEGTWKWVTGPEAGMVFYIGAANGSAPNGEFSFWNCGEPNNSGGNEDYAHITDQSVACSGRVGSWNDLPNNSGGSDPNNPYYPKGYIVEFGGFPGEPEINLSASSVVIMPRVEVEDQEVCGNDVNLMVSANTSTVLWYESPTSQTAIHSGFNYETTLNQTTTFWLEADENGCGSVTRTSFTAIINEIPNVNDIEITQCDDETIDGITTFVLSDSDDDIIIDSTADHQVQYFIDDALNLEIVTPSYENQFNNQIIYALVTNTTTECTAIAEVTLFVNIANANSATLNACDSINEAGFTVFNLSDSNEQLLEGLSPDVQVSGYYLNYADAVLAINELPNSYSNDSPFNQTIYARLEEDFGCYAIAEIELVVDALPQLLPDEEVFYCLNTFPETISLYGGITNDIPNNYYYQWSNGESTISIDINEPGVYDVVVTKPDGCSNERRITVVASNTASVEAVTLEATGNNYTIFIQASGEGSYQYALDDDIGPYQESNQFFNVSAGKHTVYIKDLKNNCGIIAEDIYALGYPRFFTPNGDSNNDIWQLKGVTPENSDLIKVEIYDRYGKLLRVLFSSNDFWDGTYNGTDLPNTDYWFVASFETGENFTGHFSLKR